MRIALDPGVFVPRPRSELMVRLAAARAAPGCIVVDLACGSGAIGAAIAHLAEGQPRIELHACDIDQAAVACAARNLRAAGGQVHAGDLYEALPGAAARARHGDRGQCSLRAERGGGAHAGRGQDARAAARAGRRSRRARRAPPRGARGGPVAHAWRPPADRDQHGPGQDGRSRVHRVRAHRRGRQTTTTSAPPSSSAAARCNTTHTSAPQRQPTAAPPDPRRMDPGIHPE